MSLQNGHGHVTPNPDGSRARCGGPNMCRVCQAELRQQQALQGAGNDGDRPDIRASRMVDFLRNRIADGYRGAVVLGSSHGNGETKLYVGIDGEEFVVSVKWPRTAMSSKLRAAS